MAKLPLSFNSEGNNEGMTDYTALPAGEYVAYITKSDYKQTKAKTGHYIQLVLKIAGGKAKGRVLFENLNLDNPNPIAVEIANKTLNSICQACDKVGVEDSEELHGIPMKLTLKVTPATATQPASNNVTKYDKAGPEDMIPADAAPAETAPNAEPAESAKKLPWAK